MSIRDPAPTPVGVLLAAGAGRRMGTPKALMTGDDGEPWLARGARVLHDGGCDRIIVVLGAAPEAESLIPPDLRRHVTVVHAADWARGQSASLGAGIRAARSGRPDASLVVSLVDLPGLRPAAVRRVIATATAGSTSNPASALVQASYVGRPGHPVLLGSAHLAPLLEHLHGDVGARPYLHANGVRMVDCTDLGGGDDVDSPA